MQGRRKGDPRSRSDVAGGSAERSSGDAASDRSGMEKRRRLSADLSEELAATDEAGRDGLATDDEVGTAFGFFRTEDRTSDRRLRN
jgi:hypothetical protein